MSLTDSGPISFEHLRQPDFSRLKKTLLCGEADVVPVLELGIHPRIKEAILGRPVVSVADDVDFMRRMGYDYVKIQPKIQFRLHREEEAKQEASIDKLQGGSWAPEHNGVILTWEDFETYDWPKREDIDYSSFDEAPKCLPDSMKVIGQYGDLFTVIWEMMGFENFSLAIYDEPELVKAMFDKVGDLILSMYETMTQMDFVGAIWFSDDIAYTSGMMVRPDFIREHLFPWMKKMGDLAARRGIPFLYHSDGVLWDVFDDIIACGVTAQHPIEPLAMDIVEVKKRVAGKLCVCGNIDVDLLSRGTPDQVEALVKKRIEQLASGGGYCIGSSNSVPVYADLKNYVTMVKTALEVSRPG